MEEDARLPSVERLGSLPNNSTRSPVLPQSACIQKSRMQTVDGNISPFHRLPRTVIEHILYIVDANSFASLVLLNRKWRRISDSPSFYAHHLSRCPSFALTQRAVRASPSAAHTDDLKHLKYKFATEVRRNTFNVFLRPRRTLIKLISTSMSSSTAFPHGEAFRFAFSPNSQLILCISSSRIVVLDVVSDPAVVRHELKTWRRPLHATILDDGSLLAVVSSSHRVNIYRLNGDEARHLQELELNDVPQALALSPTGGVLALAYSDRIEVHAIGEATLATERRAVRCAGVDSMSFSSDGVMLIGSSDDGGNGLVTISVPFFTEPDADSSPRDAQVRMWTTQILFPDIIQGYSHACLLPLHTEGDGTWILGFDREIGAFRAIGASNIHSGTAYFSSPISRNRSEEPPPNMPPTVDCAGELVAFGFQNAGIWVYGIPDRLDIAPVAAANGGPLQPHGHSKTSVQDNWSRLQESITRPKVIISGHKISDMSGVTAARWVGNATSTCHPRRLVAVAPGGINLPTIGEEDVPVDGGRVLLLDFTRSSNDGDVTELSIEIGEAQPTMLKEPNASMDTEVELERRRTRLHRRNDPVRPRAARESYPAASATSPVRSHHRRRNSTILSSSSNDLGDDDALHGLDAPYDNTQPRSRDTLRRAATAAAASRSRYNPRHRDESRRVYDSQAIPPIFQVPHESDADNWVPPPPPYSRDADAPLPDYLRRTLLPSRTEPVQPVTTAPSQVRRAQTTRLDNPTEETPSRSPLQRLNTISGSRLASRMRRNSRGSEQAPERRQPLFLRRRSSSASRTHNADAHGTAQQTPPHQQGPALSSVARLPPIADTSSQGTPTFPISMAATQPAPMQQAPAVVDRPEPLVVEPIENEMLNLQHAVPPNIGPATTAPNNHPYSLSSPNLQFSEPYHSHIPLPQDSWLRPGYHRAADRRSQSHDIRQVSGTIPALNRRASTDPTLSTSSQPSNDLWRRRIEEWNENTIHERSKRRNKCIVM